MGWRDIGRTEGDGEDRPCQGGQDEQAVARQRAEPEAGQRRPGDERDAEADHQEARDLPAPELFPEQLPGEQGGEQRHRAGEQRPHVRHRRELRSEHRQQAEGQAASDQERHGKPGRCGARPETVAQQQRQQHERRYGVAEHGQVDRRELARAKPRTGRDLPPCRDRSGGYRGSDADDKRTWVRSWRCFDGVTSLACWRARIGCQHTRATMRIGPLSIDRFPVTRNNLGSRRTPQVPRPGPSPRHSPCAGRWTTCGQARRPCTRPAGSSARSA